MKLRIHQYIPTTKVEGPGIRACIQVQGCPIHCPGCAVPFTWSHFGGYEISVVELAEKILATPCIEGITFLGGEPFQQAEALASLAAVLKEHDLSVMTFTGYTIDFIRNSNRKDWKALLDQTDLLIDGPFKKELVDTSRPWVGSSNQRYHFLTDRYADLKDKLNELPNRLEIRITPDGRIKANGLVSIEQLEGLFNSL